MITTEPPREGRVSKTWILFMALAALPFLLRITLDLRQIDLQTVQGIYRVWRWSPQARDLKTGSTLIFDKRDEKSVAEDFFLLQLQRDFKIAAVGDFPHVRTYFEQGDRLRARVELATAGKEAPYAVWEGESRSPDNGVLLGPWLGTVLILMGKPTWVGVAASAVTMLLWDSDWNPLDVPARALNFARSFGRELKERVQRRDWIAGEMGRVPVLALLIWLVPALLFAVYFWGRRPLTTVTFLGFVIGSLVLEPVALWTSELFGKWDPSASWWKVYLGSFAYRFILMAFAVSIYFRPRSLERDQAARPLAKYPLLFLSLPIAFIFAGGWDWLSATIVPSTGETLMRLRIFLIGWILSYTLGSRIFSLWLGTFALAIFAPPSTGHWNASAMYGLLADGLLLGWWMTPQKGFPLDIPFKASHVAVLSMIGWITGVLLSSVGVPLGVCWLALVAGVWGYTQVLPGESRKFITE